MSYPFGVVSDLHFHLWSQFATTNSDGVNSRLQIILDELYRAAETVKKAGGRFMAITGDVFHTRGTIDPEVLNPVIEMLNSISSRLGVIVHIIPGNHDLKSKDSCLLSSAVAALGESRGVVVFHKPNFTMPGFAMVPWRHNLDDLRRDIAAGAKTLGSHLNETSLFIHAPVNGVITGMPSHGLSAKELADYGFKYVFAGHYHHHKDLGNGVFSVGASTQQSWSDVGGRAGFLIVHEDKVEFHASHAPSFIEITDELDENEIALTVPGNYVKLTLGEATEKQINDYRQLLTDLGAKGTIISAVKTKTAVKRSASITGASTIDASVSAFVKAKGYDEKIDNLCQEILTEVTA